MAQVSMTVRMDSQLKQSFDALCSQFGMSANTAMNIFANAVVVYSLKSATIIQYTIKGRFMSR